MKKDKIDICICTYKRPYMLEQLLKHIESLITDSKFTYSVIIIDNDKDRSASKVISSYNKEIQYQVEETKNIALARNKAIESANGDLIAFIDDDEFPCKEWLLQLYNTYSTYSCSGVLGPVKPYFDSKPPEWIIRSGICERKSFETGKKLEWKFTRTGNVLLDKQIFKNNKKWFNSSYGLSGGEDTEFFKRLMGNGYTFIWCNEAIVFETVPKSRWKKSYYLKRAIIRGQNNARQNYENPVLKRIENNVKAIMILSLYTIGIPIVLFMDDSIKMRFFEKLLHHTGKILYLIGYKYKTEAR
jgi:glycosyltransferase involved in cell wall biosynthesis